MLGDLKKLNLVVKDNTIQNLDEIITFITNMSLDYNSFEYLSTLINKLKYSDINNIQELVELINNKLLEYKLGLNENVVANRDALEAIKEYNNDLKKLNIIETKKESNDSNKDIDYFTITHENGDVEMLVCSDKNAVNNFIKNNVHRIATMSATDIFNHFKEYVNIDLEFYSVNEFNTLNPNLENSAIVKDEEVKTHEVEELQKFCFQYGLTNNDIKVSVDPNGERIYIISDAIIKFEYDYNHKRVMRILKQPSLSKVDDLLAELEESEDIFSYDTEVEVTSEAIDDVVEIKEEDQEKRELYNIDKSNFDLERLTDTIVKRDVYGAELTYEEEAYINGSINYLLETMIERGENQELLSNEQLTLDGYMEPLLEKYEYNKDELSEIEITMIEKYLENKEIIKARNLKNNNPELKKAPENSGIANVVILLELVILGLMILSFLTLDI